MKSTAKPDGLKYFILGFIKKPAEVETVATLNRKLNKQSNHEIWRTCCDCGEHFDLRMQLSIKCPKCGSNNLKV